MSARINVDIILNSIIAVHGYLVQLDKDSYRGIDRKAHFTDIEFGPFIAKPVKVIAGQRHPSHAKLRMSEKFRHTEKKIEEQLYAVHGDQVRLKPGTYKNNRKHAIFIDKDLGEWSASAQNVIYKRSGHPGHKKQKQAQTSLARYGVVHNMHDPNLALKCAKSANRSQTKIHWKTYEELICIGSYEAKVVDYLNKSEINFDWQPRIFKMPNGKTYRPDLYIPDQDLWVEIKGYMRKDAQEKWDWFVTQVPRAELWNKEKLNSLGILNG